MMHHQFIPLACLVVPWGAGCAAYLYVLLVELLTAGRLMCRRELTPEAAMLRLEHYHNCTRWSGNGAAHLSNYALHKVGHCAEALGLATCWLVLLPAPTAINAAPRRHAYCMFCSMRNP